MKTKEEQAIERGNALLAPVDASIDDVALISFPIDRFRDPATAKAFTKNHGMEAVSVVSMRDGFAVRCRDETAFEDGSLRQETVGKSKVQITFGTRKAAPAEEVAPDAPAVNLAELPVGTEVTFAKAGEIFVRKAEEGDPEDSVRMIGIVMKPEVPDSDGVVTSAEEIENANFGFMKDFAITGFMHTKNVSEGVAIIQNVIAPVNIDYPLEDGTTKAISEGTWYQELYTEEPDLVGRVRKDQITGLSIGGFAKEVPITEMVGDTLRVVVPESYTPAMKRAIEEAVAKAEGDPVLARFVDLRVQEVSLVDAAANQEEFFIIKRRQDMDPKQTETAAAPTPTAPKTKSETPAAPEAPAAPAPAATTEELSLAEQIQAGIDAGVKSALEAMKAETPEAPAAPAVPAAPVAPEAPAEDPVALALTKINERLDGIETAQKDAGVARAVAKGSAAPEDTAAPEETPDAPVSKWAGTAVGNVFGPGGKGAKR